MKLKNTKLNQEFLMEGISLSGKTKWSKAKLVDIQGDKYIIHSGSKDWGIRITMSGNELVKPIIDDMVFDNEIDKWVWAEDYKKDMPGFEGTIDALNNLSIRK